MEKQKLLSAEALEIKKINEQLVNLSSEKLMYIAGAIAVLEITQLQQADPQSSA